jgi:hypothetical protein
VNILNRGRLAKSLAVILALALVIATPIGGVSVYAATPTSIEVGNMEECESVTDAVYKEDLTNLVEDEVGISEDLVTVSDAVYSEDNIVRMDDIVFDEELAMPLKTEIFVFEVGSEEELETALGNMNSGDTIKLTADIDYNKGIKIENKSITFDVGSFILNVSNKGGIGLEVTSGHVNLVGSGQFNISNSVEGVVVRENSSATVTNVKSVSGSGIGVYASGSNSVIHALGNIEVIGSKGKGAVTWSDGSVTVDGTITAAVYVQIGVTSLWKTEGVPNAGKDGYLKYFSDNDGENEKGIVWVKDTPPVVKKYFEIDGFQYETWEAALGAIKSGETLPTMKLLQDYTHIGTVEIIGKRFIMDLNGNDFNIVSAAEKALIVGECYLSIEGEGRLNVKGDQYGVWATEGGYVTVTNAIALAPYGVGVYAEKGAQVTVLKDAGGQIGAYAKDEDTHIIIEGKISGNKPGSYVRVGYDYLPQSWGAIKDNDTQYLVYTDALGKGTISVRATSPIPERICMIPDYRGLGYSMAYSELDAILDMVIEGMQIEVKLLKDINYPKSMSTRGCRWIFNLNGYNLNITSTEEAAGLYASKDIILNGEGAFNVTGREFGVVASNRYTIIMVTNAIATEENTGVGIRVEGGAKVYVQEDVVGQKCGVMIYGSGNSEVFVGRNVRADINYGTGVSVKAGGVGSVTVEGKITAHTTRYAELDGIYLSRQSGIVNHGVAEKADYIRYSHESFPGFNLWVKNATFYALTVENGSGDGSYAANTEINIQADPAPEGKVFDCWTSSGGGSFADANSANTTFTMPAESVTVTATYKDAPITTYQLTVENGSGDGSYAVNTEVNIQADPAPEGKVFDCWTTGGGGSFADANSANTTFTMPAESVTITATYKDKEEVLPVLYTITASADSGGSITPSGNIKVIEKGSKTFTITADNNYRISSVMVDG